MHVRLHKIMSSTCAGVYRGQRDWSSENGVTSCHDLLVRGSGNPTLVLCRSSEHPYPLSHLFSLTLVLTENIWNGHVAQLVTRLPSMH